MDLRSVSTEKAPKAIGPYSQAIVTGDLIFTAGQVALDPATGELVSADIKVQTARVLDNLAEFGAMNEVYAQRFGQHRPARSTIGTSALPRGARIEIECIAVRR